MGNITVSSDGSEQTFALESPSVTLGRGLESDIRLKDIKASRRHCQINKSAQGFQLMDLSSGNGTYLNGVQVKQQVLNDGDKIQIGSTTITFHGGASAKDKAAAPAVAAKAARPQGGTTKSTSVRPATSQIPVAPTRKITAKADVVRPGTQSVPKPKTQPIGKQSTRAIGKVGEKPRTGPMKKTGRGGTGRGGTGRISATERFQKESKKKSNPIGIIIGIIAAGLLIAIGAIIFMPRDDKGLVQDKLGIIENQARAFDEEGKFDAAIAKYNEALALIEGDDFFKSKAMNIRATIKQIESDRGLLAEANKSFQKLKANFKKATGADAHHELLKRAKGLRDNYGSSNISWLPDLNTLIERIEKYLDTEVAINKRLDFQNRRNEITTEFNLSGDPYKAGWGKAVTAWNTYLGEKVTDVSKNKAQNEITVINNRARDNFRRVKNRASRLIDGNQKADAIEMLKKELDRFKGTESEKDIQGMLKELDT